MEMLLTSINTLVGIVGIVVGIIGIININYAKKIINSNININNSNVQKASVINNGLSNCDVIDISQKQAKSVAEKIIDEKVGVGDFDFVSVFEKAKK